MKKEVGQLIKHSGIYGLGTILSKSVGFLMIPIYTHFLAPADYGVIELLDLTLFFGGIFAMMGISESFFRFFSGTDSEQERREVTVTSLAAVAGISLLVLALMQGMAGVFSLVAFGSYAYTPLIRIVSVTLFFSNMTEVPLAYLRAQKRTVLFVAIGLVRTVFNASLLILVVAVLKMGVRGVVYANLISCVVAGLVLVGALLRRVRASASRVKFAAMLRYGAPLVIQSLMSFVLVYSDRFFLRHFASLSEVGIYGLGYKLAGIVSLLVSGPFNMAWSWQQFELAKGDNAKEVFARIQVFQLVVSVFVGLGISLLAKDALRIMTPANYWDAAKVVPLIVISYILSDMRSVIWTGILVRNATHHLAWISAVVAASNLLFNYLLISRYSYMGAAVATVLSYALSLLMGYALAQRAYYVRYDYARNAVILGSASAIYLASTLLNLQLLASVATNLFFALLFPAIAIVMLKPEERSMFWELGGLAIQRVRNLRPQLGG